MKKILVLLLVGILSLSLFSGCQSANTISDTSTTSDTGDMVDTDKDDNSQIVTAENEKNTSITLAQSGNFAAGFATEIRSYECTYYLNNWYDTLVEMRDNEIVPSLATDWTVSDDGLVYTFNLREDVKFSDGTDFNAHSVKLCYDNMRPLIGANANYGQLDMYTEEITVDSEYTVSFHLSQPYFGVLKDLTMVCPRGIMSAAAFNEDGSINSEYLMENTAGTGPYMFKSVNDTATEYEFVENPYYWGEKPDVKSFTVKVIPDSKIAAMKMEEVDFVIGYENLDIQSYNEISGWEGFEGVRCSDPTATEYISVNANISPLNDVNLRRAMQMAIDKESIVENLYSGMKTVANSVLSTELPYCGSVSEFAPEYNKDEAIRLLEESGYIDSDGDGFREFDGEKLSFEITYPSNGAYDKTVLAFQSYMKDIGIEITTNPIDLMTFFQNIYFGAEYEMTAYITYWVPYDPYSIIANMYPSMDYNDPSGLFSTDPQIAYALATMDIEEAKALIAGVYNTDDTEIIEEIYTEALNCANTASVVMPIDYINDYAVYNTKVIESYEFNTIPNHVDIAAIKLK